MVNVAQTVTNWARRPFNQDMDVLHWVLFTVLILVIAAGWRHVTKLIEVAAS